MRCHQLRIFLCARRSEPWGAVLPILGNRAPQALQKRGPGPEPERLFGPRWIQAAAGLAFDCVGSHTRWPVHPVSSAITSTDALILSSRPEPRLVES